MRIATWNVNSIKQRLPRFLPWLDARAPDVICLQEDQTADDAIAELLDDELARPGHRGGRGRGAVERRGIAVQGRARRRRARPAGRPGFPDVEARAVSATCAGIRVHSLYVPNGRAVGSDHYEYKLAWLDALRRDVADGPADALICGDMNIAPADADLFDPTAYLGQTHVTEPERAALRELYELGLHDIVRERWPADQVFSYWDYRAGMFHQNLGMRIDLILGSAPVTERVKAAWIDRQARKGTGPSDHAP
ncbi:MAG: exodeoxyribonuclease III [Actinomycetota bacterium]|nr:exodeoxyribonuclease III [Actinomycetota bacterium]MDQ2956236.1 exodeoxyribonuclease III [Actinomycetota bacterium]